MTDRRAVMPRNVATAVRELAIAWADGHESYYPYDDLRRDCPCATCRARAASPAAHDPLRIVQAPRAGTAEVVRLEPVGAYAVRILWADGHGDGIYAWEQLRAACPCPTCRAERARSR